MGKISALSDEAAPSPLSSWIFEIANPTAPSNRKCTLAHLRSVFLPIALASEVSGILPVANGGTGFAAFGAGVATFLATPSGANLATALSTALPATKGGTGLTAIGTALQIPRVNAAGNALEYVDRTSLAPLIDGACAVFGSWKDTAATDATAVAPKIYLYTRRNDTGHTTTATANQVVDAGNYLVAKLDLALPNNAITTVEITIEVKRPGTADGGTITLVGTFIRNGGGAPVRIGTDDTPTPKFTAALAGTTGNLNINGNYIDVRVSPGAALTLDYGVIRVQRSRTD